jgi:hypothetical protein
MKLPTDNFLLGMERISQQSHKLKPAKISKNEVVIGFEVETGPVYLHPTYAEILHRKTQKDTKYDPSIWFEYTVAHTTTNLLVWRIYRGHNHIIFGCVYKPKKNKSGLVKMKQGRVNKK